MNLTIQVDARQIDLLNKELALYARLSGKTVEETLEKKGRDLGIQLYRGFKDVQWGGPGRVASISRAELAVRTAQGRGTIVRPELRARYSSARKTLNFSVRSFGQAARYAASKAERAEALRDARSARRRRAHLWRKIVGAEIALRQSGRGVMAAAFLTVRKYRRYSVSQGKAVAVRTKDYVKNRTGRAAAYTETGPGYFRVVGLEDGMDVINARYGITDRAVAAVRADMAPYLRRKLTEGMAPFKTLKAA